MKKIAFITRHSVSNYGSLLQTYATCRILKELGYDPVCINYWREEELPQNITQTLLLDSRMNRNFITRTIYRLIQKPAFDAALFRFQAYRRKFITMTEREYHTEKELRQQLPEADVYMTGSDQTWNTITRDKIDPAYFLSFVPDNRKKISYAASFGKGSVRPCDRPTVEQLLRRYDHISVREDSGVEIVGSMGLTAEQVLDPTLLLSQQQWRELLPDRKSKEKYVLIYQLVPNKAFEKYALKFAKRHGLKLLRLSPNIHHALRSGRLIYCPPAEDFLWYIKNAEYLLTDSFHATAFALLLNTQFIDILPNSANERIESILHLAGIDNRILQDYNDTTIEQTEICFEQVNKRIAAERERSLSVLKRFIEE
ncbi:MAG: polysaccharide pyruvyl transferase family protein [Oscillospiraceae bacterium]